MTRVAVDVDGVRDARSGRLMVMPLITGRYTK